ncbi:ImmA/IrrE family metallo-endopeptidase [Selenomonas ruminis]|uniref:ImmA/IrrE family metallo-endopeptidase n=1 Tax=Selenomonas ruminis TaxID=2593411 RepID=A0A5D6W8A4_9FIRM|nr:ImmA/IrrE family metallo-endopeptidase [Selenomonas sp. mPRGC5]TYZ22954.1 ImmA/IrrE family metallo-endopeptidase [Selenomonas sp. mPRGC5]
MGNVFEESLFSKQYKKFEEINFLAKAFSASYCGSSIVRDSIFGIVSNYARKRELSLEILRYPFKDDELWAFTFVKKGTVFLCVNSGLAICKQIFAVAHELYHIHCYAEDIDPNTITCGSLLDSKITDDLAVSREDLEANAFAGLILMPDSMLDEQLKIFGIVGERISVDDVLTLMDLFALPYKAVVLRLAENRNIALEKIKDLLMVDADFVSERIMLTGKALRWQQDSRALSYFGSLLDDMEHNSENDLLTDSREKSDRQYLERIRKYCRRDS